MSDMIGKRFGRLVVIGDGDGKAIGIKKVRIRPTWILQCDCGTIKELTQASVKVGSAKSCGCYQKEKQQVTARKNAKTTCYQQDHPLKSVWWSMHVRCYNKKNKRYHRYGGRGIKVCERWNSFENFVADMPPRPEGFSIDRIDNDKDYEPGNCRWADSKTQGNNTSQTRFYEYKGERLSITQLAEKYALKAATLWIRLKSGWNIEEAIERPLRKSTRIY
jgi:hypothetical protein